MTGVIKELQAVVVVTVVLYHHRHSQGLGGGLQGRAASHGPPAARGCVVSTV